MADRQQGHVRRGRRQRIETYLGGSYWSFAAAQIEAASVGRPGCNCDLAGIRLLHRHVKWDGPVLLWLGAEAKPILK